MVVIVYMDVCFGQVEEQNNYIEKIKKFRNTTPYVVMVKYSLVFWAENLTNCNCVPILLMCSWIPIYLLEYPCDRMVMLIIHTCPRVWDHWLNAPCTLYVWICIYTCMRFWQFQLHWTTASKPGKIETSHRRACYPAATLYMYELRNW
jgi:hypothetical protein